MQLIGDDDLLALKAFAWARTIFVSLIKCALEGGLRASHVDASSFNTGCSYSYAVAE